MRSSLFRILGGSLLTFAIVWALVLAWWQSNDYEPSKVDLALYLGALPLALVGGYLLLRGFIEHIKAPPPVVSSTAPSSVSDDDPLAGARAKTAAAERTFSLCLVETCMTLPAGASDEEVLSAIEAGKRPGPSARLSDDAGFPVFLAEVQDIDVDAMTERLSEDVGPIRQLADQPSMVRALALLDGTMVRARESVEAIFAQSAEKLRLHLLCLVPADCNPAHFPGMRIWLQLNYWSRLDKADLDITLLPAANEADALRQVDEIILRANRDPSPNELVLIVGAVSAVDELTVESWAASNRLFSAQHQDRRIPGEGAIALLFATRHLVEGLHLDGASVISRVSHGARDKSLDAGGRIGGKLITQLVAGLLDVTTIDSTQIKSAVFDSDHRANHVAEAMEGLGEAFEHLDPAKDCLAIGTVNGALSPIGSLVALACARAKVLADQAPVLCVSNQHELDRAVLLAMPFVAANKTEPSSI
ncbi:hypothetical protein ACLIKD_10330 [Azonexus sp. IMCC34842]|uniref:hypothetical protein n=1 Tax=Azonexus sp. IMCC34842 TaxID=3420950 RepID=UPI003D10212C